MISMEFDCVTYPGDTVPPNPGPSIPNGYSVYAQCGGVYPLALFADRLVTALLEDTRHANMQRSTCWRAVDL